MFGMELTLNAVPSTLQIPVFCPWYKFRCHSRDQVIQKYFLCEMHKEEYHGHLLLLELSMLVFGI